jgi:hypothetical protein
MNGLEPECRSADEVALGETYAKSGLNVSNFDMFANQCSKYGYRVPSKEKFIESYNSHRKEICSSPSNYFKASYSRYEHGGSLYSCDEVTAEKAFNSDDVKEDAFKAHQLSQSNRELGDKIRDAHQNGGKKKYDNDRLIDILVRAVAESDPVSLEKRRQDQVEQLKSITKKYSLFISDLDTL